MKGSNEVPRRAAVWPLWGGLGVLAVTIALGWILAQLRLGASLSRPLPVYGAIAEFSLTNQVGRAVSLGDLRGHVWVADIIFTRCAGPCLKMSRQMKELEEALPGSSQTRLVTLTTDPVFDTPAVLQTYAERFGAKPERWLFLTGTKPQIAALAVDSLKLTAVEKTPEERANPQDLFIHSTIFVLADKRGRLRGVYETEGEGVDAAAVKSRILAAAGRLEREP